MQSNIPFIDIHTHQRARDLLSIYNIDQRSFDEKLLIEKPVSLGVHPWFLTEDVAIAKQIDFLKESLINPLVKAVGECGLDKMVDTPIIKQMSVFEKQIALAEKFNKPLILHCVKAYNELILIKQKSTTKPPWIIHGYNKKMPLLEKLISAGFYISIGHKVLKDALWLKALTKRVPIDKLFFETDDSDAPISAIYLAYAQASHTSVEVLKEQILNNYKNVFGEK